MVIYQRVHTDLFTTFEIMVIMQQDLARIRRLDGTPLDLATLLARRVHESGMRRALCELEVRWKDAAN